MKNHKTFRVWIMTILLSISTLMTFSQISIENYTSLSNAQTASALVDSLMGMGVNFSNPSLQGVRNSGGSFGYQFCYFTATGLTQTQMGISRGVALTSGNTNLISIPIANNPLNAAFSKGYVSSTPGEIRKSTTSINDMNLLAGGQNWFNGAILEFDFVPQGDSIIFKYVFGGEEYSDGFTSYNCTQYNDKFGFLISGPGITGGAGYTNDAKNIARLSNGSEVGINSVNNGTVGSSASPNGASYCTSANPDWTQGTPSPEFRGTIAGTALNGNTIPLYATHGGLTPGATYRIRLLILDARDGAYDAIVYIEAGSFSSPLPSLTVSSPNTSICSGQNTVIYASMNYGEAPYTYQWSNGSSTINTNSNIDSITVSPTSNTYYYVTVTDNNSNTYTDSIQIIISNNVNPTFTLNNNYCVAGTPNILPNTSLNGVTGSWSPNTINTATATTAGNPDQYTTTVNVLVIIY